MLICASWWLCTCTFRHISLPNPPLPPQNFRIFRATPPFPFFPPLPGHTQSLLNKLPSKHANSSQTRSESRMQRLRPAPGPRRRRDKRWLEGGRAKRRPAGGRGAYNFCQTASSRKPSPAQSQLNITIGKSALASWPTCRMGPMLARDGTRQTRFMSGNWRPRTSLLGRAASGRGWWRRRYGNRRCRQVAGIEGAEAGVLAKKAGLYSTAHDEHGAAAP